MAQVSLDPYRSAVSIELIHEIDAIEDRLVQNRMQAFLELAYEHQHDGPQWLQDPQTQRQLDTRAVNLTVAQSLAVHAPPAVQRKPDPAMFFVGPDHQVVDVSTTAAHVERPRLREEDINSQLLEHVRVNNARVARVMRKVFEAEAEQLANERELALRTEAKQQQFEGSAAMANTNVRPLNVPTPRVSDDPQTSQQRTRAAEQQEQAQRARVQELEQAVQQRAVAARQLQQAQANRELARQEQERQRALEQERQAVEVLLRLDELAKERAAADQRESEAVQPEAQIEANRARIDPRTKTSQLEADREEEARVQEAADIDRWNDIAAWEASRRVAQAQSEIGKIMDSDHPDLGQVYRWMDYASHDNRMVSGLRAPDAVTGGLNGRTTSHYRPMITNGQLPQLDDTRQQAEIAYEAKGGATNEPANLMAAMMSASAAGRAMSPERGAEHAFVHPFEPVQAPGASAE